MRFFSLLTAASLLYSVSASYHRRQQIPGFPTCADNCLNSPSNLGGCLITDFTCLCNSFPFLSSTLACIQTACQGADQQTAINGAETLCLNFGVTLTTESSLVAALPTVASGASTTGTSLPATSSVAPAPTTSAASTRSLSNTYVLMSTAVVAIVAGILCL